MEELRTKVMDKTSNLERSIEEGCDREAFPVVICAGMEYATVRRTRVVSTAPHAHPGTAGFFFFSVVLDCLFAHPSCARHRRRRVAVTDTSPGRVDA